MTSLARTKKSLLTRRLNSIAEWLEDSERLLIPPGETEKPNRIKDLRVALRVCEENIATIESSLHGLGEAFENISERSAEDDEKFDKYVESANDMIIKLVSHKAKLLRIWEDCMDTTDQGTVGERRPATQSPLSASKLPEIPIPNFSGKRWEWDNYWALFLANVHEQDLTDLQKFNYLLSSLSGEAKQSISRFQVSAANYSKALDHLKNRYGHKDGIILELHRNLDYCTARGPRTEDQRQLFEKLSALAAQLKDHGEHLDNYLAVHTFLQKFHGRIQKAATKRCMRHEAPFSHQGSEPTHQESDNDWTLELWLSTIDSIISEEERLQDMLPRNKEKDVFHMPQNRGFSVTACECCKLKGHKWSTCPKIPTPTSRRAFLLESNRCLNCGSNAHRVASCTGGNCRKCHQKHHTAICTKSNGQATNAANLEKRNVPRMGQQQQPAKPSPTHSAKSKLSRPSKQHVVTVENQPLTQKVEDVDDAVVLQVNKRSHDLRNKVILLVGSTEILDAKNMTRKATVLLDTGSELSFIREDFAQELGLPVVDRTSLMISTFGTEDSVAKKCDVSTLQIRDVEGCHHELRLFRSEYITGTIEQADLNQEDWNFINQHKVVLSLQKRSPALQPEILLGCDYLWNFMMPMGKLTLPSGLQLIPTKFGYIISGLQSQKTRSSVKTLTILNPQREKDVWDRYWSLESSGTNEYSGSTRTELQQTNEKVLQEFCSTVQRRNDGYYVRLPWKPHSFSLPDNKMIALRRLHKILEMYANKKEILLQYDSIFKEQLEMGIIEEVQQEEIPKGTVIHYLSHQAVITPAKETTKMRIVFDASAHYKDKPCLNDVLHQGPPLLPDLVSILLRFRAHNIAIISDVEKAFLQVRLQEIDRDATRCLWVRNTSLPPDPDNIVTYRFTRVTFGLNTSPFLLGATITFHLDNMISKKDIAKEIKENLYVDNLIIGARSTEEALDKYRTSKDIFNGMNMNLREFLSNDEAFNNAIDSKDRTKAECPKVLGVPWKSSSDTIILRGTMATSKIITKRTVSMQLASVFDPLGLLVPVLLPAKVFLQSLWKDDYEWDTPLAPQLHEQWRIITCGIATFYKEIGRKVVNDDGPYTMFVFADASHFAMATCVHLGGESAPNLVMAKSKLASIKTAITVPKLEMNAITLGARVAHFVYSSMSGLIEIQRVLFFTDSEIVLGWMKASANRQAMGVLVANRLKEVRRIVDNLEAQGVTVLFGHIPTALNPADCATRGLTSASCQEHFWWNGPQFIHGDITKTSEYEKMFPLVKSQEEAVGDIDAQMAAMTLITLQRNEMEEPTVFRLARFSSLYKAKRVVAYVHRFIHRLLQHFPLARKEAIFEAIPALRVSSSRHEFTDKELREAKNTIIRDHQKALVDSHRISSQKELNIQPDQQGILRCYGRLDRAAIPVPAMTPIFIVPKTALARLIIEEAHTQYHCGVAHTMATVRQTFWIPKLRQQVSRILRTCLPCQKLNNLPFRYPNMGNLPESRVQRTRPFEHIGLDYFGPLPITNAGQEETKAYGCILTCCATRLIHLELVENMTTEAFLNALRRFFARRGVPKSITCDNAPIFLLGEQILFHAIQRMLQDTSVESALARREIEWIHITPYAPWQGGFYERLIRSVKHSLYKALGKRTVSFDVLRTTLTEIEAVLNSRPLTYQEERWEQQPILRPIDFLQSEILLSFPLEYVNEREGDATYHTPEEAQQLATQRRVEEALKSSVRLTEKFWNIWSAQYLTSLREHHKLHMDNKRGTNTKPKAGDIVLLGDASQPRNTWKIGRIIELRGTTPDSTREVVVELPNKSRVRRPVNRIVPLEVSQDREISPSDDSTKSTSTSAEQPSRYNLRKRKHIFYGEEDIDGSEIPCHTPSHHTHLSHLPPSAPSPCPPSTPTPRPYRNHVNLIKTMPFLLTIIFFFSSLIGTSTANDFNNTHHLQCTEGGVVVSQKTRHQFEICSEDYCLTYKHPRNEEVILFPPHIVLHEHVVKWKIFDGNDVDVLETTCAAAPFCTQIDCTFCVAIIANPECWPRTAIVLTGLLIYVLIALCYFLFHVPVIIGHPILYTFRIFGRIGVVTIKATVIFLVKTVPSTVLRMLRGIRRNRRRRLWSEISILLTISCTFAKGCQEVNIFDHQLQSCRHTKGGETCTVDTLEIVKINPFKQEACLRLTNNRTNILEVKLLWKSLDLICEKETMMFTRSTRYGLLDSKRCPHTGSCIGQKCGAVHRHSRIAELDRANQYAGVTGCVESCGGPGCDCFYLSSGCLFYRIYLIPNDDYVYEIFRCTRWKQTVQLQMTVNKAHALMKVHNFRISPNQPRILSPTTITLSSITVPPTPLLNSAFVADRKRTALAPHGYVPPLRCGSREKAENMTCDIVEDCHCHPAEIKMLCDCKDFNLTAHMLNPEYQLPILRPNVEFRMKQNLIARIPQLPTAEFILRIKDEFRTTLVTSNAICTAKSTQCTGCYNCGKGARAEIICTSSTPEARAEIQCDDYGFVVPCTSQGAPSELHFFSNRAQFYANCSIQCGTVRHSFEIVGILRYTGILHAALQRLLDGESEVHSEINFPDIGHIIDVFLRWSGTLLITIVIVLLALLVSYLFITNGACLCIPRFLLRFMILINRLFFRILRTLVCSPLRLLCYLYRDRKRKLRGKLP